jgi:glycosyltransferase involved in cell wall biosynthesis
MPLRIVVLDGLSIVPYYTGHLCAHLASAGGVRVWSACVTYQHDPKFFTSLEISNDPGLLDFAWKAPARLRRMLKALEYVVNLTALLVRFILSRPDAVHVQFLPLLTVGLPVERWFLRLVRAMGVKVVYTVHNVLPQDTGDRWRSNYAQIYAMADRLICHDEEAAERLVAEFAVPRAHLTVIPHGPLFEGVSSASRAATRERLGFGGAGCVFLWQGILRPYKGISFLLKAWRDVCTADERAMLAIVGGGDPELAATIDREVSELGLRKRVRLDLRFVTVEQLIDYLEAADVLVYPYSEITTSGALMTGVVRGKPVVATSLAAFRRILVHEENALLVPYGDVAALAENLLRLAVDPELRKRIGENLRSAQRKLPRWPEIAAQTYRCYVETLQFAGGGSTPFAEASGSPTGKQGTHAH